MRGGLRVVLVPYMAHGNSASETCAILAPRILICGYFWDQRWRRIFSALFFFLSLDDDLLLLLSLDSLRPTTRRRGMRIKRGSLMVFCWQKLLTCLAAKQRQWGKSRGFFFPLSHFFRAGCVAPQPVSHIFCGASRRCRGDDDTGPLHT